MVVEDYVLVEDVISNIKTFTQQCQEEWENDQLFEMANIHSDLHGIRDVVIWVGKTDGRHGLRVKVSNTKNKFDIGNHFVIQMPSLDYDPSQVAKWISANQLKKIFMWIKLNQKLLYDYETGIIDNTRKFEDMISPIS